MNKIKYNENNNPILYILASPIGNLHEINQRFKDVVSEVDIFLCEDTRVSGKLLSFLGKDDKKLISYHAHNEYDKLDEIINLLTVHHKVAMLSDAGYPLLSDPGSLLVKKVIELGMNVVVVNGANAIIPALINSGFSTLPFTFIGFLSKKSSDALIQLEQFKEYYHTLVLYESIHRVNKTLKSIFDTFGDVEISISRELTKMNEEHIYGRVSELLLAQLELKGELVICINNVKNVSIKKIMTDDDIINNVSKRIAEGLSKKNAIKEISKSYGLEKNYVYDLVHKK